MRPRLEDHLLQEVIGMERASAVDDPLTADAYARLVEALRAGRRLGDVGGAAPAPGELFSTTRHVRELGIVLDALLAVGATDAEELEVFLLRRAGRAEAGRRARRTEQERRHTPTEYPLQERLDELLARRSPVDRLKLASGLLDLGLIDWHSLPDATVGLDEVGEPRETALGPPGRHCGVRVVAVEHCDTGVVLHLHWAINPMGEDGEHPPLDDEVAAEAPGWPSPPDLRLRDGLGTTYRGVVSADELHDVEELSECLTFVTHVAFAPAVPADAATLWLASDDGQIWIDLR
jgi:hypothetical protein